MDITTITTALKSLKLASDIIVKAQKINTQIELGTKITELQGIVTSISSDLLKANLEIQKLQDEKSKIEKKLIDYENWGKEKTKYESKQLTSGTFIYAIKKPKNPTEEKMWFCAKCFNDKQISILQPKVDDHFCPLCKTLYRTHTSSGWGASSIIYE